MKSKLAKSPLWWVGLSVTVILLYLTGCRDNNRQTKIAESVKLTAKVLVLEHVGSASDAPLRSIVILESNFRKADALAFVDFPDKDFLPRTQMLPEKQMDAILQAARTVLNSAPTISITNLMTVPYGSFRVKMFNRGSRNDCVIPANWVAKLLKAIRPFILMQKPNLLEDVDDLIARLGNMKD